MITLPNRPDNEKLNPDQSSQKENTTELSPQTDSSPGQEGGQPPVSPAPKSADAAPQAQAGDGQATTPQPESGPTPGQGGEDKEETAGNAQDGQPTQESPAPVNEPDEPVALGDKVSQFEQTKIVEEPALISLSDYGDAPAQEEADQPSGQSGHKRSHARTKRQRQEQRAWGCFKGLLYTILVLGVSLVCTYLIIGGIIDITGLQKSDMLQRVDIEQGASTSDVADALKEAGLIEQKLIFRLYSKMTGADGKYQPGTFYLSADMGYGTIISTLQEVPVRETVTVTIPEGSTVEDVARILSENGVCNYNDFYAALVNGEYDYEFLQDVPKRTDAGYEDRIYWLEGYLFPDTYEYYVGISGEDAIDKLLSTFASKISDELWAGIEASGYSLDEVITLASIVQGEAADTDNMPKVARVILNRLENYAEFPYLQCDSTGDYLAKLSPDQVDLDTENSAYDTYTHMGLPPGPINNPSLAAIMAVVNPSEDERIMRCYYFANDSNRNTYYSETYEEHVAICERYGIGIHAN